MPTRRDFLANKSHSRKRNSFQPRETAPRIDGVGSQVPTSDGGLMKRVTWKFGAWNVRTMLDREDTRRQTPERRTSLLAREFLRHDLDVVALSGPGGSLVEQAGYTFF